MASSLKTSATESAAASEPGKPSEPSEPNEPNEPGKPSEQRSRFSRALDAVLFLGGVGILILALWPKDSGPPPGGPSSPFDLPIVESRERFVHTGPRERPLLIEAFASWCTACRRSAGNLEVLKEAADKGVLDVVAISVDDQIGPAIRAKHTWPIPIPVLHDERGEFQRAYDVKVLPTFILIGTDGQVREVSSGPPGASDFRRWLNASD